MTSTFYSIFVDQASDPDLDPETDLRCKMMLASCSKFDHSDSDDTGSRKKFDPEEEEFSEEFGPDGYPRGKRLAPVGANEEVSIPMGSYSIR